MLNRRDLNHTALGCMLATSAVGIYHLGRASAQNIPSMPTMFYGVSLEENGAPVTGNRDLRVRFFDGEMGGTQLCETLANSTTVTQGRARIALSESCRTAVQQNANVWVELAVGGSVVGTRSRIGAVPYAVEAQRANDLTPTALARVQPVFRAEQTANVESTGGWVDIPGIRVNFTLDRPSDVDAIVSGGMAAETTAGHCGVRFVMDDVPELGTDTPTLQVYVLGSFFVAPWTGMYAWRGLAAGNHTIRVQIVRMSPATRNCFVSLPSLKTRMIVSVR